MLSRRSLLRLGGVAVLGVGAYFGSRALVPPAQASEILSAQDALSAATAGDILLVDIRRPDEWAQTGIGTPAVAIDMRADDFVAQVQAARRSDSQPIALICARGGRSAHLARKLRAAGLSPIVDVSEGMLGSGAGPGWLKRDLPTRAVSDS